MKAGEPKIYNRTPEGLKVPITIEYHFIGKTSQKDAEEFTMPKEYKEKYNLLSEVFELIRPVDSYRKTCPTVSFYRIIQLKQ